MTPKTPNNSSKNCGSPTPSSCVPYNGNDIPCIPICAGDTMSEISYKLGQQICYTSSLIDFTDLDISCFYTACPSGCTLPTKLVDILQIYADYFCTLKTTINALNAQILALGGTPPPNI